MNAEKLAGTMREPRTVEEWQERFQKFAHRKFPLLPAEIFFSEAYRTLTYPGRDALIFAWNQIRWGKAKRSTGRSAWSMTNDTVYLPTNALSALGIKSSATQTKVRKELVRRGFLDVVKTGSFLNPGVFKISERWRQFPKGDYLPKDKRPAGRSMGHKFEKRYAQP